MFQPTSVSDLLKELTVDAKGRDRIASLVQGSPEWLRSRWGRLTASNFGAAAGHHGKAKQRDLVKNMVFPETAGLTGFAQRFAQYGKDHEEIARRIYVKDRMTNPLYRNRNIRVFETGLLVSVTHGWLGASPDFVVEETVDARVEASDPPANKHHLFDPYIIHHPEGYVVYLRDETIPTPPTTATTAIVQACGEIKCPAAKVKMFYSEKSEHALYGFPVYYYDQIQGAMAINSWPWCDVVVFNPDRTQVTRFYRDEKYWSKELYPKLESFYFDMYLPALAERLRQSVPPSIRPSAQAWISPHVDIVDIRTPFQKCPFTCTLVEIGGETDDGSLAKQ